MYETIDPKKKSAIIEAEVAKKWEQIDILGKSSNKGNQEFVFFEGPPTANGKPGIHHVMARSIKDTVCRYKTMQGYRVKRKAGWDTHGLPVEIEVQKQLGLDDRKKILDYGVEQFNQKCRDSVFSYEKLWRKMTQQMGYEIDLDNPYITLDNDYIESVWWLLNQMWGKGLLYQGHKVVPFCPKCGTPLSSHEVAQGYKEVSESSVYIKFRKKGEANAYFLAWTTTPWTLVGNVALVVGSGIDYVKVECDGEFYILAKNLLSVLDSEYKVVAECKGQELLGQEYEPLFTVDKLQNENSHKIYAGDFVTTEDGTGIVHTAGMYGEDDYQVCKKHNIPLVHTVGEDGKYNENFPMLQGLFVKDKEVEKQIIIALKEKGLFFKKQNFKHTYPFCWRCDSPLLYYARMSWYIKTTDYKDKMIEENKKVNWAPPFVGEGRFGSWLENNTDWAISRDRFWGTPLNVWICDDCACEDSIGSKADLQAKGKLVGGKAVGDNPELHKPFVDDIILKCPKCGGVMHRVPQVIDCWFDSGAMPFAQHHYPFENKENFDELYPADFICEGIDQTRGWFYSLLAISTIIKGQTPYKNVLVNDLILDKTGKKMSKSKGNTVNPFDIMDEYGADAVRWYLLAGSPPWVPTKFDSSGVKEVAGKFFGTLKNVYSFFATYANIDGYRVEAPREVTSSIDRWIFSKLNKLIAYVQERMDAYDLTKAVRAIQNFACEELSNWYVRRSRERFWSFELSDDKKDAYYTLHTVLVALTKMVSPVSPFLVDHIYCALTGEESVHLATFPKSNPQMVDAELETKMDTVIQVVSLGRFARNNASLKVRQPLAEIKLPKRLQAVITGMEELILEEINIKKISFVDEDFVSYSAKPNFKSVGKKVGKHMKALQEYLLSADVEAIREAFEQGKVFSVRLGSEEYQLAKEDLVLDLQALDGYQVESNGDFFVALQTELTDELIAEGYVRELINKIQFTRKNSGFDVMDRIVVSYYYQGDLTMMLADYIDDLKKETLADSFEKVENPADLEKWDINGLEIYLKVEKV